MNFVTAAQDYLDYILVTRSNGTYRYQLSKVNSLVAYFEHHEIEDIEKKKIITFIGFLKKRNPNISETTINKYISTLKRIYKYNLEKDLYFDKLPEIKKITPVVPDEVIATVFNHLQKNLHIKESLRNYVIFRLILDTGLRINEVLNLQLMNFDLGSNTIHVTVTKTKTERYVFFTRSTKILIERLIACGTIDNYLFVNYTYKKKLSVDNMQSICYRLERSLDLPMSIRPHKWRHTFATRYLKQGGDLESLRLILGHTNLHTTQIYLHIDKDHLKHEYVKAFERA